MVQTTISGRSTVWGFRSVLFWLGFLVAIGIISIGVNGLLHPGAAAEGFGIPIHHADDLAFVRTKAVRDIVSGLVGIAFLLLKRRREFSIFLLIAALIPIGDFLLVLLTGDQQISHLAIHSGTALYMLIVGGLLYWQSLKYDR